MSLTVSYVQNVCSLIFWLYQRVRLCRLTLAGIACDLWLCNSSVLPGALPIGFLLRYLLVLERACALPDYCPCRFSDFPLRDAG